MGKSARLKRERAAEKSAKLRRSEPLVVTVATVPSGDLDGLLTGDLELVRSGILYADSINLHSVGATLMRSVEELRKGGGSAGLEVLSNLSDEGLARVQMSTENVPDNWRELMPAILADDGRSLLALAELVGPMLPEDQLTQLDSIPDMLRAISQQIADVGTVLLGQSRMNELWQPVRERLVTLSAPFVTADPDRIQAVDLSRVLEPDGAGSFVQEWLESITTILSAPNGARLLDARVSALARDLQSAGLLEVPKSTRRGSAEALAGGRFVSRLPAFPSLPLDELMDIRRDLDDPLQRYRAGVSRVASALSNSAFSADWLDEADEIFDGTVAPAVVQIQDELKDHTLIKGFARSLGTDTRATVGAGSAIVSGVTTYGALSSTLAAAAAAAMAAGAAALSGNIARNKARREITRREFYYVVEVDRALESRRELGPTVIT